MKRALLTVAVVVALLTVVVFARVLMLESRQPGPEDPISLEVDADGLAQRFATALTFRTISNQDRSDVDAAAFVGLHEHLAASYPRVHAELQRETVNDYSLLYTWPGTEPDLAPVLLMGHLDVVPVVPGTEADWQHPAFAGIIDDEQVIWGRGALDDKSSVVAILEAAEMLVSAAHRPRRTVYLAFGHDEEVGGPEGAGAIAALLDERGVGPFALVLDEGGAIVEDTLPGVEGKAAVIGIAEKGFISLELSVEGEGGHSSRPPEHTNIGILAAAIQRLEDNQFPPRLDGANLEMIDYIAPELPLLGRIVTANLWLFGPVLERLMVRDQTSAAMVRTTTAATMFNGGVKDNVLPITATAVVNFRILPGDTKATVMEHVSDVVDDERVQVRDVSTSHDPSPVSDTGDPAFALLGRTLRQVVGNEVLVTPYLLIGGTDAKYYSGRSPAVFRFLPVTVPEDGLSLAHGTNERLSLDSMVTAVRYMHQLILNTDDLPALR